MKAPQNSIKVSICIANYNGINFIDDCILSIFDQSFDIKYEIIIHDDASTDGSADHIELQYPDAKLIRSSENIGFCISNNRMANIAKGEFLLFLNNDASLFPNALQALYKHAQNYSHAILGLPQYNAITGEFIDTGSFLDMFLNPIPNKLPDTPISVGMIIGACLWVPKDIWDDVGGFPVLFHTLAEDMYLCCAARLKGYPSIALHESGFFHYVGKSIGGGKVENNKLQTSLYRRALSERNKTFVMITTYPTFALCFIFPLHCFLLIIEGLLLSSIKMNPLFLRDIYLHAIIEVWKNRHTLLSLRKKTSISQQASVLNYFSTFQVLPHKLRMLVKYGLPSIST